ncbi:MAG: hypothetical protein JSS37_08825 [Proteobacteria bacterium]|nr:hypothetical protein [Pseudomonadota bacterium]
MTINQVITISFIAFLSGCTLQQGNLKQMYSHAVNDAAVAESGEISDRLFAINSENQALRWQDGKVLVVTWKSQCDYKKYIENETHTSQGEKHMTWVTAAPQVQAFCQSFVKNNPNGDLNLRLKQYLGLNADWNYDVFVELWVDPADMFRPCVDPEIHDNNCQLHFSECPAPPIKEIADYYAFYKDLYFKSFRYQSRVPWTGLGYTYDWGNPASPVGASEYILRPNSAYRIERVVETADYCR